ncbi:hypothetical protein NQ314_001361 [Rhamnusium bicolor]|uniref:Small ribosomal subunit protein mS35 mitochondrial conserved domain-containing protein n=1 Tax=Rhamnusium bicolor TaxID=1586634 RepID=A0AAV8ZU46_9CUCU|nr:hypothetical protein NQ314_001361 [Rhamnusium bicolor]
MHDSSAKASFSVKCIYNIIDLAISFLLNQTFDEFRVLNLKHVKGQVQQKRQPKKFEILPPRTDQMPVDQDWGSVWPGPRSFHPATVPLPVRQGYVKKGAPPDKYGNAELMKIPNFLHLTPPVIKRQCEALKKFCTPWPKALDTDEKILTPLQLNARAKDKFLRLVGDRYNEETDTVTIVTDRCPLKKQNYDYAMYLITALYHESWNVEPWEETKSEADMEYYDWNKNVSKASVEAIFGKSSEDIPNINVYSDAVSSLMNEGESEYTVSRYGHAVRLLLNLPTS